MIDNGIILIDKPAGMTSFGVVARLKRVLNAQRQVELAQSTQPNVGGKSKNQSNQTNRPPKIKVGHTGTLDPFATGLMILVVGKECKNAQHYTKLDKTYQATIRLGQTSTTGDPEGELIASLPKGAKPPSLAEVCRVLSGFTGQIQQRPPVFSAIKINGQRAYKLARDGKEIELPLRTVNVYSLELIEYSYPEIKIRTHVSSGTYIRSLAVDIGQALGVGAYCSQLRRVEIADWRVDEAGHLADFGITS